MNDTQEQKYPGLREALDPELSIQLAEGEPVIITAAVIDELESSVTAWLDSCAVVTCVYCGHQYPDGTPAHKAELLTEHIKMCEAHPMRALEEYCAKLERMIDSRPVPRVTWKMISNAGIVGCIPFEEALDKLNAALAAQAGQATDAESAAPAPEPPVEPGVTRRFSSSDVSYEMLEDIEADLGMGCGAWDCVPPNDIIAACWNRRPATAPPSPAAQSAGGAVRNAALDADGPACLTCGDDRFIQVVPYGIMSKRVPCPVCNTPPPQEEAEKPKCEKCGKDLTPMPISVAGDADSWECYRCPGKDAAGPSGARLDPVELARECVEADNKNRYYLTEFNKGIRHGIAWLCERINNAKL